MQRGETEGRTVELADGVRLSWRRAGSGPALLFLHGVGGRSADWCQVAQTLSARAAVLSWDARGYGDSDGPLVARFADFADDLLGALDALGLQRVLALGHSMGGRILIEAACRAPERFAALMLCGTQSAYLAHMTAEARDDYLDTRRGMFEAGCVRPDAAERIVAQVLALDAPAALRLRVRQDVQALRPEGYLAALAASIGWDRRADLSRLTMPVTVVTGERDLVCPPAEAEAIAAACPRGDCIVLPGVGHMPNLEAPEAMTGLLAAFVARHGATASGASEAKAAATAR